MKLTSKLVLQRGRSVTLTGWVRRWSTLVLLGVIVGGAYGCKSDNDREDVASLLSGAWTTDGAPDFSIRPSVNQLHVLDATPGDEITLLDAEGVEKTATADDFGTVLWRDLTAGRYEVNGDDPAEGFRDVKVADFDDSAPEQSFYNKQTLTAGHNYITTRDGTTLSAFVALPDTSHEEPFPTVVLYSGYGDESVPIEDDGTPITEDYYTELGYAAVFVDMRGTGCSGGSFEFSEPIQSLDGYDIIETVAAQDWVLDHRVGMIGASYSGYSQLYVAATQPPSLAAITPHLVFDDAYRGILRPGGILNTGFAGAWATAVYEDAEAYGLEWSQYVIDQGDTECDANQDFRSHNADPVTLIGAEFFSPEQLSELVVADLVNRIKVPVFLVGAWQDEQTGAHFATMLDRFTGTDDFFVSLTNGDHNVEVFNTANFQRHHEFLDLFVAQRTPDTATAADLYLAGFSPDDDGKSDGSFFTETASTIENRFKGVDYDSALATFRSEAGIRILFESGASDSALPGAPVPRFSVDAGDWPVATGQQVFYFQADGALAEEPSTVEGTTSYISDPSATPKRSIDSDNPYNFETLQPNFNWVEPPAENQVSWTTPALDSDLVVAGSSSVDVWLQSSTADTDLEVTLTEIQPNGTEVYVQSGWLRASHRAINETSSTDTRPVQLHLAADAADLPVGEFVEARMEVYPVAHVFRAGSQLRISIDAPGGNRSLWAFDSISDGETNTIATGPGQPSRIVLSTLNDITVPAGAPACESLNSQPCR